jgi:hypothetical protein
MFLGITFSVSLVLDLFLSSWELFLCWVELEVKKTKFCLSVLFYGLWYHVESWADANI